MLKHSAALILLLQCSGLLAKVHPQHRIIGGYPAVSNAFPYLVSVQKMIYVYVHVCGGSLIKENYVLTAAHCITNDTMRVRADLLHIVTSRSPTAAIAERHIHPNYTRANNRTTNDLAVLKLATSFTLSAGIQLIGLPLPNAAATGKAVLSGWGTTNSSVETFSNSLMYTVLEIISLNQCKVLLTNSTGTSEPVSDGNLCTYSSYSFSCYRDDGGPLVQNATLVGVSSWQIVPCDTKNAPSVFTNVSRYVDWINQQIV